VPWPHQVSQGSVAPWAHQVSQLHLVLQTCQASLEQLAQFEALLAREWAVLPRNPAAVAVTNMVAVQTALWVVRAVALPLVAAKVWQAGQAQPLSQLALDKAAQALPLWMVVQTALVLAASAQALAIHTWAVQGSLALARVL